MKEAKGVFFIKNWSKKKRKSLKTKEKQSKIPRRATDCHAISSVSNSTSLFML